MSALKNRTWWAIGVPSFLALTLAIPLTTLASTAPPTGASEHGGTPQRVILILKNQNKGESLSPAARSAAVRTEQSPLVAQLKSAGAQHIATTSVLNSVIATVSPSEAAALATNPAVSQVIPDGVIKGPSLAPPATAAPSASSHALTPNVPSSSLCGTASNPQLNPEALTNINATPAQLGSNDGAGITVAYVADGVDPTNADFQRNAAYQSAGSPAGSPVLTQYDFSGDGTAAPTPGGEAFLDSSSIAAQGNQTYDISQYVSTAHPLPSGCDIKIVGVAPGADLMALKVFAQNDDTTTSGFIQAINFAVSNGAKVINESFGSNNFPDTTLDAIRDADDAAVAAGTTVVVSSGDAGSNSTIGSPASDPNVISVGATTTFRSYAQETYGGINDPNSNGTYVDNNISDLSSGGFTQSGRTVDLVAPGDLNWALCSTDTAEFNDCTNENGGATPIQNTGGTSESSPLTAGAAADVIQAYAQTHGGTDPSPALVKQILTSTATDIDAPAVEQGAGLLNVLAAVNEARSMPGTSATPNGGILVSPNQINVQQRPGATTNQKVTLTNTGSSSIKVSVSTRALTTQVGNQTGSFCMQPGTPTASCPANTGAFPIWSGVQEVYQDVHFTVPSSTSPSRLDFTGDYPYTGQSSLMHFALIEPSGTYAGYSLPQGLADFGNLEVTNPPAGTWTAVFFTEQDGATEGGVGTSGTVQWDASTLAYGPGGPVSPSAIALAPGGSQTETVTLTSPSTSGDNDQSIVITSAANTTTIPVTVRTVVPITPSGGTFSGVLTGGNGRSGAPAQTSTYAFNVPSGEPVLHADVALSTDAQDTLTAYLVDPNGQTIGYSTNDTQDSSGNPIAELTTDVYHLAPEAGQWLLILDWANPVSGAELSEPFTGEIDFNPVPVSANLPDSSNVRLMVGKTYQYSVHVTNTGQSPEAFFVDPRLNVAGKTAITTTLTLLNQNGSVDANDLSLPLGAGLSFPYYIVPTHTGVLQASINGSVPVTFDAEYFPGDPDVSPVVQQPGLTISQSGTSANLSLSELEVTPGLWLLNPDELGPYGPSGAPSASASESMSAVTQEFDPALSSSTGDMWSAFNGVTSSFAPVYVPAGQSATITVSVTPSAPVSSTVTGSLNIDDYTLGLDADPNGDELAAIPYSYQVVAPPS